MTDKELSRLTAHLEGQKRDLENRIVAHETPGSAFGFPGGVNALIEGKAKSKYYDLLLRSAERLADIPEYDRVPLVSLVGEHYILEGIL